MTSAYNKNGLTSIGMSRFLTWWYIGCLTVTLVASQQGFYLHGRYGKRQEPRASFLTDSRYGRSEIGETSAKDSSRLLEITPRADRFFLGSRYGKRMLKSDGMNHLDALLQYLRRLEEQQFYPEAELLDRELD
ncbi:uncharacterized protein RYa [Prorops nasuta]|uniref:uncharacterized protein RYa n=1 Tax=Prorops nasuta TaxID=863751 RepID=UPI0034CE36B9